MNEPRQAELLARWLASGGTEAPPPELDPDVVEAIYALRPELAPPPSVSVDDILAGVTEGPFAADAGPADVMPPTPGPRAVDNVVPFPVAPSRPAVAETAAAAPRGAGSVWWIGGGVGALAAAAALVLVLGPQQTDRAAAVSPAAAPVAASEPAPPAAIPEVVAEPSVEDAVADAGPAEDAPAQTGAVQTGKPTPAGDLGTLEGLGGRGVGLGAIGSGGAVAQAVAPPARTTPDTPAAPGPAVARQDDDAVAMAERDVAEAERADEERAAAKQESLASKAQSRAVPSAWETQNTGAYAPANTADAAPAAPPAPAASGLDAALAEAARTAESDAGAAARQLEPWIGKGTVAQGQRVALTAARYARDAGDLGRAESLVKAGLARGGEGTSERSRLQSLLTSLEAAKP